METEKRRNELLNLLRKASKPLTGAELARHFNISRQVIVQDIAILRASGEQIFASFQGYMIPSLPEEIWVRSVVACRHTREQIKDELGIVVDLGGRALDVIVEHPVYGELRGNLMVSSRRDLNLFLESLHKTAANPLLALTGGIHLHTLEAPDQKVMQEITASLDRAGYLVK
ncbi:MAG: transcription repressor NadR [Dethiobacter sp.]|jgi:transcriptional regulator of NAD metabolism|nr:MAG: transcription repressor NadR [Dethiobacter sp.]